MSGLKPGTYTIEQASTPAKGTSERDGHEIQVKPGETLILNLTVGKASSEPGTVAPTLKTSGIQISLAYPEKTPSTDTLELINTQTAEKIRISLQHGKGEKLGIKPGAYSVRRITKVTSL